MSGMSNVRYWLSNRRFPVTEDLSKAILNKAKASNRTLEEAEVLEIVRQHSA
jgi:hypothetical protein